MKAIFVQDGNAIDYTPSANVAAGDVVVIGTICTVAKLDIPANTLGAVATKGVFDVAKGSTAITLGAALYWDATNKVATTTATSNTALGVAIAAADAAAETVRVLIK